MSNDIDALPDAKVQLVPLQEKPKARSWSVFLRGLYRAPLELPAAIAHSGPYAVYGLCLGWLFLWLSGNLRSSHSLIADLAQHISEGFFVASVAVLLYEWGAHFKELMTQSNQLSETIRLHVRKIMDASARDAVKHGVQELLDMRSEALATECDRLLASVVSLYERGGWCRHAYLSFINIMLNSLRHNAENLVKLSNELALDQEPESDFKLRLPDPGHLADVVLSKVIDALDDAGQYLAVSDIDSWLKIPEYVKRQKKAVARGVRIRRIFVVPDPPPWHATKILLDHYGYTRSWLTNGGSGHRHGAYEIRIMRLEHFMKSPLSAMRHFGVFKPSRVGDAAVMFEVTSTDLSSFRLRGIEASFLPDFESLWLEEADRTPEQRADLLLSIQMECPDLSTYHVVSDFNSWRGDKLKGFREYSRNAMKRGVTIRRLFVRRPEMDPAVCRDILRDHYEEARDLVVDGHWPYEVNVCTLDEAKAKLHEAWHFGVFRSSGRTGLKVMLSELPSEDFVDFGMEHVETQTRSVAMEALMDSLPPVRDRALQLLDVRLP
jgi:hypothetical protein